MKLANIVILAVILSTLTLSKRRRRVKSGHPANNGPFAKITATIESVILYDDNLIKIADDHDLIEVADDLGIKSKTEIQLTGERKIRKTESGVEVFYRLAQNNKNPELKKSVKSKAFWVSGRALTNLKYPITSLMDGGYHFGWNYYDGYPYCRDSLLTGYKRDSYGESSVKIVPYEKLLINYQGRFKELNPDWETDFAGFDVTKEAKAELSEAAKDLNPKKMAQEKEKERNFMKAVARVVAEAFGHTVLPDDDRYQLHLIYHKNILDWERWDLSVKMDDGTRNYLYVLERNFKSFCKGDLYYNANKLYEMHNLSQVTINILSPKRSLFNQMHIGEGKNFIYKK